MPTKKTSSTTTKAAAAKKAPAATQATAPKPAKKSSTKAAPLDKFTESQQKLLLEEREVYTRQATTLRAEADQLALDRDPGDVQFDEESGQGDSMNVERERDLALSAQALASIEEIDRALEKIHAGTYGVCEKCNENIPKERLKALPYAALCVKCKSGGLSRR
jgi:DnaK suppressor protein